MSTSILDHLPDTDLGIDLDAEAMCTLQFVVTRRAFCANPASWAVRLACCGYVKLVCDQHRDITASVAPKVFVCNRCGTTRPPVFNAWRI